MKTGIVIMTLGAGWFLGGAIFTVFLAAGMPVTIGDAVIEKGARLCFNGLFVAIAGLIIAAVFSLINQAQKERNA